MSLSVAVFARDGLVGGELVDAITLGLLREVTRDTGVLEAKGSLSTVRTG